MLEAVAQEGPELRIGRVDATVNNGLGRTFGVRRYPTVLLFTDGEFYEFNGPRSVPRLLAFARGVSQKLRGIAPFLVETPVGTGSKSRKNRAATARAALRP